MYYAIKYMSAEKTSGSVGEKLCNSCKDDTLFFFCRRYTCTYEIISIFKAARAFLFSAWKM